MNVEGDESKFLEKAYELIEKHEEGVVQSDLWKKLGISSRRGSQIVRELVKRGLVERERTLHRGRWTYRLHLKKREGEIDLIRDLYCLVCPLESKCSGSSDKYLITCKYLEEWTLSKYRRYVEGKVSGEKE